MRKEVIKVSDELVFTKQLVKSSVDRVEKEKNGVIEKLNGEIKGLQSSLKEKEDKYQELLEKNNEMNNSGVLNSSAIYDGYESIIK